MRYRIAELARRGSDADDTPIVSESIRDDLADAVATEVLDADAEALTQEPDLGRLLALTSESLLPDGRDRLRSRLASDRLFVRYVALFMDLGRGARTYDLRWNALAERLGEDWVKTRVSSIEVLDISEFEQDALDQARHAAGVSEPAP